MRRKVRHNEALHHGRKPAYPLRGLSLSEEIPSARSSARKMQRQMTRTHRVAILLNDSEWKALNTYLSKYDIKNRSQMIRETLMMNILQRFDADNPTLF